MQRMLIRKHCSSDRNHHIVALDVRLHCQQPLHTAAQVSWHQSCTRGVALDSTALGKRNMPVDAALLELGEAGGGG